MKIFSCTISLMFAGFLVLMLVNCNEGGLRETPVRNPSIQKEAVEMIFPDGFTVTASVARTDKQKERGLMFVKSLPSNQGMYFPMEYKLRHSFWMKNCYIPLDMIWLDKDNVVVDITKNAPPCKFDPCPYYSPSNPVSNVLEVNGGISDQHGLKEGDKIILVGLQQE